MDRPLHCGQPMVPIVYGMPGSELMEAAARGEVSLGGCVVHEDMPAFVCLACEETAGRIEDLEEHMEDDAWG